MNRYARDKNDSFRPKPVTRVNIDIENRKLRIGLVAFFLALAVVAFGYFGIKALGQEPGWKEVTVVADDGNSCASEFTFYYNLGHSGISATAEYKALTLDYQQMTGDAFKIFHAYEEFEGIGNLATLNAHPNETVTLEPALYAALEKLRAAGDRTLFLAPVYQEYHNLFFCNYDFETVNYDPYQNPEVAEYFREVCGFTNDPAQINLELLGDNRARLNISEAYLSYARENAIETFLDLYWMKNAFVVDYLADSLLARSYYLGTVSSNDGFCRVLDPTETAYSTDILDWAGSGAYRAGVLQLEGPVATISLHTYDLFGNEEKRYYKTGAGELRFPYIDPADGLCKAALNDLVVYGKDSSCAELVLRTLPFYLGEFSAEGLRAVCGSDLEAVYCQNQKLLHTEPDAVFTNLFTSSSLTYEIAHAE